eukprot:8406865-Prorocentrum_lima.AAC.1
MTSSLVGSEMCIRDRGVAVDEEVRGLHRAARHAATVQVGEDPLRTRRCTCLLYTSDAADDM